MLVARAVRAPHFRWRWVGGFAPFPRPAPSPLGRYASRDRHVLSKTKWQYIVVDEGQRIKNQNCKLVKDLGLYSSAHRLLLSGTPLQVRPLEGDGQGEALEWPYTAGGGGVSPPGPPLPSGSDHRAKK